MPKGDKSRLIMQVYAEKGQSATVDDVFEELKTRGYTVSKPLIYKVKREMGRKQPVSQGGEFSTEDLQKAKAFVMGVGSLARAKELLGQLEIVLELSQDLPA